MVVAKILASLLYVYTGKLNFQDVLIIYLPNMIILLCGITVIYELWNNWNMKKSTWKNRIFISALFYIVVSQVVVFLNNRYVFPVQFDEYIFFENIFYYLLIDPHNYYSGALAIYTMVLLIKKTKENSRNLTEYDKTT